MKLLTVIAPAAAFLSFATADQKRTSNQTIDKNQANDRSANPRLSWASAALEGSKYTDQTVVIDGFLKVRVAGISHEFLLYESKEALEYARPLKACWLNPGDMRKILNASGIHESEELCRLTNSYVQLTGRAQVSGIGYFLLRFESVDEIEFVNALGEERILTK